MKKTIAYILIIVLVVGLVYYFLKKDSTQLSGNGESGEVDPRSEFQILDDKAFKEISALLSKNDRDWIVKQVKFKPQALVAGQPSKSLTLANLIGEYAPNVNGKYPPTSWSYGKKVLWPHDILAKVYAIPRQNLSKFASF